MPKTELILKTLTPLWTGGIDTQVADRLHEAGIIGSLRWWYEAILRGCGVQVCDPTSNNAQDRCNFDEKVFRESKKESQREKLLEAGVCDACQLFGATGFRRRWRFTFKNDSALLGKKSLYVPSGHNPNKKGGWYLGNGFFGKPELQALPLHQDVKPSEWELPLHLAAEWGGIGAKTQHGFGIVKLLTITSKDDDETPFPIVIDDLLKGLKIGTPRNKTLPDLRHCFFAKIQFVAKGEWWKQIALLKNIPNLSAELGEYVKHNCLPVSPVFRNWLRYGKAISDGKGGSYHVPLLSGFIPEDSYKAEVEIFGEVRDEERQRSRINISSAYQVAPDTWEIRVWGWLPPSCNYDREIVLDSLKALLQPPSPKWMFLFGTQVSGKKVTLVWREFDSARDTLSRCNEMPAYLRSLLKGDSSK